ncbi:MAG: c-type cytochrome [Arenimonas sp.]
MRKLLKGLGWVLGVVVVAVVALVAFAWWRTERMLAETYTVADPPLVMATDAATLDHGRHQFTQLGCAHCHGEQGQGHVVFDAPPGRLVAPNLTPTGLGTRYDADGIAAAIRHGVRADGHPLRFMPAADFHNLSDADTAALVAYVQALPPSANVPPELVIRPLGRVLTVLGQFELVPAAQIDHTPQERTAPPAGPTAEYGAYLAQRCTGCHGDQFAGGHVPGTPPSFPDAANLTPHAQGLGPWSLADFQHTIRTGINPSGHKLDEFMPWKAYATMSDDELAALYAFLRTVPEKAPVKR